MKTIGLLGGMSWESTREYYRILNEETARRLGGLHSAECVLYSVDFAPFAEAMAADRWDEVRDRLFAAAQIVERSGARMLLVCTNTMHLFADELQERLSIPILHIADAAGKACVARGVRKVLLLGTRFTMEKDFYRRKLEQRYGLEVLVPGPDDRELLHRIIFDELCRGVIREESRTAILEVIARHAAEGADGVILACTELPLILRQEDSELPLLDTTELHAREAVDLALE